MACLKVIGVLRALTKTIRTLAVHLLDKHTTSDTAKYHTRVKILPRMQKLDEKHSVHLLT